MHVIPEERVHVASCFVNAVSIVITVHHIAFAQRNLILTPLRRYDRPHHIILSIRVGITIVLTAVTFGEFIYQLDNKIYPGVSRAIFYSDQVLSVLTWATNVWLTVLISRNAAWVYFTVLDHFLTFVAWIFLVSIEALRFQQYVFVHVKSTTEQLTTTIILAASLAYFLTVVATVVVVVLRRKGRCLLVQYSQLDVDDVVIMRGNHFPANAGDASVPEDPIVVVHRSHGNDDFE